MPVRVKLNRKGFQQLRRDPAVKTLIGEIADDIAADGGEGYLASVVEGKTRSRASVITTTPRAMRDNAQRNTLVRSLASKKR